MLLTPSSHVERQNTRFNQSREDRLNHYPGARCWSGLIIEVNSPIGSAMSRLIKPHHSPPPSPDTAFCVTTRTSIKGTNPDSHSGAGCHE
jgi:hypothetical protein